MATSIPEGTVAQVPCASGQPALAVVARRQPRGHCVALYVFATVENAEGGMPLELPAPHSADYRGRFADEPLRTGAWPVLGVHPSFRREDWPFDKVAHQDRLSGRCLVVRLDDRNPLKITGMDPVDCGSVAGWPSDAIDSPYLFAREVLPALRGQGA